MQAMPLSEPECVVPPTPSMRALFGKRLRTSSAPGNGVAPSWVSAMSSTGPTFEPSIFMACAFVALTGQLVHGRLNMAFAHVSKGAFLSTFELSESHLLHTFDHLTSVHCVPR